MSLDFSADFKELVRSRTDIVDLIGESCALEPRRGGREYVGLCPFHDDHNPSLTVSRERQSYKCWSCGEGGDCFTFVQKIENVEFREALELLAQRANLELPTRRTPAARRERQTKNRLYELLSWAAETCHQCLQSAPEAEPARNYLAERGFQPETIARFRLGYHPNVWDWLLRRAEGRYSVDELAAARLAAERRDGSGYRDDLVFIDRVLFPIRDVRSRVVAFGGRVLPGSTSPDEAKYRNSADSTVFSKSRLLYGFDLARDAVRRQETAVVVEGYTDCIMAHQHGIPNAVGTLGTALTEMHVTALKRFARKVVLVYDGDEAGRNAAERSLAKFLAQEIDLRILTLPAGVDPADYLDRNGRDAFQTEIDRAPEAWQYKLGLCSDRYGLETVDGRDRILGEMLDLFVQAPGSWNMSRKNLLLTRLAQRLGLSEPFVRQRLEQTRKRAADRRQPTSKSRVQVRTTGDASGQTGKHELLERELLEIIFAAPETIELIRQQVAVDEFENGSLAGLLQLCYDLADEGVPPGCDAVLGRLEDPGQKRLAMEIEQLSREKEIAGKLRLDGEEGAPAPGPTFLELTIRGLKCRRMEADQRRLSSQGPLPSGARGGFDEEAKARLRQAMELKRMQASLKTPN